jgi:hypothetical protein
MSSRTRFAAKPAATSTPLALVGAASVLDAVVSGLLATEWGWTGAAVGAVFVLIAAAPAAFLGERAIFRVTAALAALVHLFSAAAFWLLGSLALVPAGLLLAAAALRPPHSERQSP